MIRSRSSVLVISIILAAAAATSAGCGDGDGDDNGGGLSAGGNSAGGMSASSGGSGAGVNLGGNSAGGSSANTGGDAGAATNPDVDTCSGSPCANYTGSQTFLDDTAPSDVADLFGSATSNVVGTDPIREPTIIYPSHETMFPINVSHIRHEWAAGDNDLYELRFEGPNTTVIVYTTQTNWLPTEEQWDWIAESNRGQAVQFSVRGLDSTAAGDAYEADPITLYFSAAEVEGAIYYWSTGTAGVMKALVSDPVPVKFYTDPQAADSGTCVACHTLSRDGKRLAVGYGGEKLREVSVPERETIVPVDGAAARASAWTTFSQDGELLLVAASGVLTLIDSDTGEPVGDNEGIVPLPDGKFGTHPDWSALGDRVVIALATKGGNKDTQGSSIAILPYNDGAWGEPEVVVANANATDNNYFPVWSPDSQHIAYVNATGTSKDAVTAHLRLLNVSDWSITDLVRVNERVNNVDGLTGIGNSMPTWAPSTKPGIFWVAFSSLRAYATVRPQDGKEDQIWIAAIDPLNADPSYSAFWAPFQNIDAGNHRAFWTHTGEDTQCLCQDICGDSLDNDCDGTADESDCVDSCASQEICDDGIDNNCDCIVDGCVAEDCTDGVDNDNDGLADDKDPSCTPNCDPSENCNDGMDNDCDGLADAKDPDCIPK